VTIAIYTTIKKHLPIQARDEMFPKPEPEVVRAEVRALMYEFYDKLVELGFTLDEATALSEAARRDASIFLNLE
jgi:hypothetical protein